MRGSEGEALFTTCSGMMIIHFPAAARQQAPSTSHKRLRPPESPLSRPRHHTTLSSGESRFRLSPSPPILSRYHLISSALCLHIYFSAIWGESCAFLDAFLVLAFDFFFDCEAYFQVSAMDTRLRFDDTFCFGFCLCSSGFGF